MPEKSTMIERKVITMGQKYVFRNKNLPQKFFLRHFIRHMPGRENMIKIHLPCRAGGFQNLPAPRPNAPAQFSDRFEQRFT